MTKFAQCINASHTDNTQDALSALNLDPTYSSAMQHQPTCEKHIQLETTTEGTTTHDTHQPITPIPFSFQALSAVGHPCRRMCATGQGRCLRAVQLGTSTCCSGSFIPCACELCVNE